MKLCCFFYFLSCSYLIPWVLSFSYFPSQSMSEQLCGAYLLAGVKPQQKGTVAPKEGCFKTELIRDKYISSSLFARFSLPIKHTCSDPQLIC